MLSRNWGPKFIRFMKVHGFVRFERMHVVAHEEMIFEISVSELEHLFSNYSCDFKVESWRSVAVALADDG